MILKEAASDPSSDLTSIIERLGLGALGEDEIEEIIDEIIRSRMDFILKRGERAVGPLMGPVMERLRGRIDGRRVNEILKAKIEKVLEDSS